MELIQMLSMQARDEGEQPMGLLLRLLSLWILLLGLDRARPLEILSHQAFPVVEPDPGHTKLAISKQGLELISSIKNPISVVAVIGPYRSGKSFLLNQLLSLTCNEGFGVGHLRDTQTRGIWLWGEPMELTIGNSVTSVLFMDTEGFESIGKSNVYDDRIFALAALLSSVLIYNLPETVREADISKLSFAVELGEEFYGRVKGHAASFEPSKLLWLIQRDFLEGKTVQEMVREALQPVVNPTGDKDIDQVNRIRESLSLMAQNSTAFGLPQPHLHRTKLCEMDDSDLDPEYIKQRESLKELLRSMIRPKVVQGKTVTGKEFAAFLEQTLEALNEGEFPSAGSVVDSFNRVVIDRCMKAYNEDLSKLKLPMPEQSVEDFHQTTAAKVMLMFDKARFGRRRGDGALHLMESELSKAYALLKTDNDYASSKKCDRHYTLCENKIEEMQDLRLPSMAKFTAGLKECNQTFELSCMGPSKPSYRERLSKMMLRTKSHFVDNYNQKLFNWLVVFSLVMVVVGRFVVKFLLLEVAAWGLFVFLETYTRIFWSAELLYYNPVWQTIVAVWETTVYSPILDMDRWLIPLAWFALLAVIYWRFRRRKRAAALQSRLRHMV
ncbi:hypothetical protein SELMODRAFT_438593 [Selaginella moellendorffii]|uniref:GB1/RHD3-type G domain-containing protein n=1 Tax=Selaginella moellendorffii TaxID=88036 RepID=D8QWY2_SELML|nr:guanylate-binding protein 5 [Selaginella moellendorffii]EFJ35720.1 hypothetical protein SELMODRAFT_438593 [Selaginella moellendorffii]|eukprot:XP_002963849.1 guanylate-binding protein 5 [Selaginella moellendorffii]